MASVELKNINGETVGSIDLADEVFQTDVHEHLLWETVKWQRAKRRAGTHSTKRRGEVHGTSKKVHKQKGTGRARAGSRRAAQWVGGGSVFGPKPRSYEYAMPKKARKKALRSALSLRLKESKLVIVDAFTVADGKTKAVASALGALGVSQPNSKALIVDGAANQALVRGAKNLASSMWIATGGLNVYDVLNHETLVLTQEAAKQLEETLRP
jgi:large subunit ribosomal protein L4